MKTEVEFILVYPKGCGESDISGLLVSENLAFLYVFILFEERKKKRRRGAESGIKVPTAQYSLCIHFIFLLVNCFLFPFSIPIPGSEE